MAKLLQTPLDLRFRDGECISFTRYAGSYASTLTEKLPTIGGMSTNIWRKSAINSFHRMRSNRGDFHSGSFKRDLIICEKLEKRNATPWRDR